jgi:hypothetical protein
MGLPVYQLALDVRVATGGTVTQPSGGTPVAWTIPAGVYADFQAVVTAIASALATAIPGSWGGSVLAYGQSGISIGHATTNFDLTVDPTLASWLSLPATSTDVRTVTSTGTPPTGFWPRFDVESYEASYRHLRYQGEAEGELPDGGLVSTRALVSLDQLVRSDELAQWRLLRGYLARGVRVRVWLDRAIATAWSWTERRGRLDLAIDEGAHGTEYAAPPDPTYSRHRLTGVVL